MDKPSDSSKRPETTRDQIRSGLVSHLQAAGDGRGRTVLIIGERGTGKTHLCRYLAQEAGQRSFILAQGRAYKAESGAPYTLLSDAFLPLLRAQPGETLTVLSRGGVPELARIFPGLGRADDSGRPVEIESPGEERTRVLWTFVEVLRGLSERDPLLVILEDLQWADPSSLEAIHFLVRHMVDHPVVAVLTRGEIPGGARGTLGDVERSLLGQGIADEVHLSPFSPGETKAFLQETYGVGEKEAGEFALHLHDWTQGNPFFLEETLQGLVQSGALYRKGDSWLGWETRHLELPRTVREAILEGLNQLPPDARDLAELAAVLGTKAPFSRLREVCSLDEDSMLESLDLLVERRILTEGMEQGEVVYDFRQNLVRETILKELGLARAQVLHGRIARTLSKKLGAGALQHADILAYHYVRAPGEANPEAILHLSRAGRNALARFANQEAAHYLGTALDLVEQRGPGEDPPPGLEGGERKLLEDLARALSRMAQYTDAIPLWEKAYRLAEEEGAWEEAGECRRRIGIIEAYRGNPEAAVEEYDRVLEASPERLSPELVARVRLRRGVALEEMGRLEEARTELENVLEMAEGLDDPLILAQAHRALVLLHIWTGNPARVREHGQRAMELAKTAGSLSVEFWTHWGLAVLEGLLGHTTVMAEHVQEANRVAQELRSPILKLRSAELAIEEAAATGRWSSGIVIGEQAIALARSLSQNTILPRLLVWTALIYLAQGEVDLARPLVDEAWEVAGAGAPGAANVHAEIPAYIGRGYLALAEEEWDEAIRIGREALAIADEVGYGLWAIHRLVPLLGEAYLFKGDLDGARQVAKRLQSGSSPIRHKLGLAWGHSCEALITWMDGNPEEGARMMEAAALALEEIPMIGDAARLRRLKASGLVESGDRKGALEELHKVHEIFLTLGAEVELEKTRQKFRELDARPPRRAAVGEGELSPRELEIARLVEERKSNKAIAKELGISPRTVSTHLSNVYQKLGISSRGELADYVREEGLAEW